MKFIYRIFLYLFLIIGTNNNLAGGGNWKKLSFGIVAQYSITGGDLNNYWGNIPSAGFLLRYYPGGRFSFGGIITGSYLAPKEANSEKYPDIVFINSAAVLRYNLISAGYLNFNLSPGISNTTFVFTGDAAELSGDNFIEHEFGIYCSSGAELKIFDPVKTEIFVSAQSIFSSPVNLVLYTIGLKVVW
jgi:hypothetical protein